MSELKIQIPHDIYSTEPDSIAAPIILDRGKKKPSVKGMYKGIFVIWTKTHYLIHPQSNGQHPVTLLQKSKPLVVLHHAATSAYCVKRIIKENYSRTWHSPICQLRVFGIHSNTPIKNTSHSHPFSLSLSLLFPLPLSLSLCFLSAKTPNFGSNFPPFCPQNSQIRIEQCMIFRLNAILSPNTNVFTD